MDLSGKSKGNIWKLYVIALLGGFAFFYNSVETLYYRHFGLSFQQIGTLISASLLVSIVLDIPSGAFADIYGRKKSLLLGSISCFLALCFVAFGSSFYWFLTGFLFWGAGLAFNSGAQSALLYDSLKNMKQHTMFTKHTGRLASFFVSIDILSGALGPLLFMKNVRLPYIVSWIACIAVIGFQLLLFEKKTERSKADNPLKQHARMMYKSFKALAKNKTVVWLTLFSLVFYLTGKVFSEMLASPYIIHVGYTLRNLSLMALCWNIIQTSLTFFAVKFERKLGELNAFILLVFGTVFAVAAFIVSRNILLTGLAVGLYYSFGSFREVITASYMNHNIPSENRATMISISSTIVSIVTVLCLPQFGFYTDRSSLQTALWTICGIILFFGIGLLAVIPYKKRTAG